MVKNIFSLFNINFLKFENKKIIIFLLYKNPFFFINLFIVQKNQLLDFLLFCWYRKIRFFILKGIFLTRLIYNPSTTNHNFNVFLLVKQFLHLIYLFLIVIIFYCFHNSDNVFYSLHLYQTITNCIFYIIIKIFLLIKF